MGTVVKYDNIFQYNESRGVETLHPLVSVIDFSKAEPIPPGHYRHRFGFYAVFLKDGKKPVFLLGVVALIGKGPHEVEDEIEHLGVHVPAVGKAAGRLFQDRQHPFDNTVFLLEHLGSVHGGSSP